MRESIRIPDLCQACHKHHHSTVVKECPLCSDVQLPEEILCDLVRDHDGDEHGFQCSAFRPTLSVMHHDHTEAAHTADSRENTVSMSPKDKWFQAYAVQQLGINPDLISFKIRYHVVFSTRQRAKLLSSQQGDQLMEMLQHAALPFENTTISVLCVSSDHMHLYIDTSPDYSLDEIVHAVMEYLEHGMTMQLPELKHTNQPFWARAYFAEGVG